MYTNVHVSQINSYIINDVLINLWNVGARMKTFISPPPWLGGTCTTYNALLLLLLCRIRRWIYVRTQVKCIFHALLILRAWLTKLASSQNRTTSQAREKKIVVVFMPTGRVTFVFFSICADKSTECIRMNKRNGSLSIDVYMRFDSIPKLLFEKHKF